MTGLEEGVLYRIDRNGNVKRVEDATVSSPKKSRKQPADDKSETATSD